MVLLNESGFWFLWDGDCEASNLLKGLGSNGFHEFGGSSIEFVLTIIFLSQSMLYLYSRVGPVRLFTYFLTLRTK